MLALIMIHKKKGNRLEDVIKSELANKDIKTFLMQKYVSNIEYQIEKSNMPLKTFSQTNGC